MIESLPTYNQFISSANALVYCRQSADVEQLLSRIREVWRDAPLNNENLIQNLNKHNHEITDIDPARMANTWLPFRYHRADRGISWCLPGGAATEPFHDQYIERCRQQISLNQFLRPRTSLLALIGWETAWLPSPAGFIFHLSRCGSTLLSGSFAKLGDVNVLSESQLLTEVLLDPSLSDSEKKAALPKLISLQGGTGHEEADQDGNVLKRNKTVIKWNAWDILFWPVIRSVYPDVPVVLIVRDPVEILASHHRLPGRHMAGDPSFANLHPAFPPAPNNAEQGNKSLLDYRIGVLKCLMKIMLEIAGERNVSIIDYNQLDFDNIIAAIQDFDLTIDEISSLRIRNRMNFHSKEPNRRFYCDSGAKQALLSSWEIKLIQQNLGPLYQELSAISLRAC